MNAIINRLKRGTIGWALTAAAVIAWDLGIDDTMSAAFERGLKRRATRPVVVGAWAILTLHLFCAIPQQFDPFHQALKAVKHA